MPKKTKKPPIKSFFRSSGVTATAIVALVVGVGAVVIPGSFAAESLESPPTIKSVQATPSNSTDYAVTVKWDGHTNNNWVGQTVRGGSVIDTWASNTKSKVIKGLSCGVAHAFKVAPAGPNGGAKTAYKSDSATPRCPGVAWSAFNASSTSITLSWRNTAGFSGQSYRPYVKAGGGYTAYNSSATSLTLGASCGTTYSAYIVPSAGGQSGPATDVRSVTTAACPTSTPQPPSTPSPQPPSGGGSGGTTSSPRKSTTTRSAPATAPAAPSTPENFSADVVSSKLVKLHWNASSNVDHYKLQRSVDDVTWQDLAANIKSTDYVDETTDFSTTYYYRLQAVGADGQASDVVDALATTEAFEGSNGAITSADKLVTIIIPDGAIDAEEYDCSLSINEEQATSVPEGQSALLGPYDLLCVTMDGMVVESFDKPLVVNMKVQTVASGYSDLQAGVLDGDNWKTGTKSSYDPDKQIVSFIMVRAQTFAALGAKQSSPVGMIIAIFFILLLIAGAVYLFLRYRNRDPQLSTSASTQLDAEQEFRQALAQPDCSHLGMAQQVIPSSQGCYECEQQGTNWKALRICLLCGHVGCSDDSPQQHALKHYQETGHPIIYDYADANGNSIGWCYVDQTYI